MHNVNTTYKSMSFGVHGKFGNVGNHGNPVGIGSVGAIVGCRNVEL